ncbi:MAG TPA: sigma-54 dependent transcriptional regulator [Desulfohalobiaceae bacterium]|nr:sigma-54 dependent transcriptional regulator [Desulfohalobiaceae bacterium]
MTSKLLLIYKKNEFQTELANYLQGKFHVFISETGIDGLTQAHDIKPEIILLDANLPDTDGIELLKNIQVSDLNCKVIMIGNSKNMESTIQAMKFGAYDFVPDTIDLEELEAKIHKAIKILKLNKVLSPLSDKNSSPPPNVSLVGQSQAIQHIFKQIGLVSKTNACVGIMGETGTGKEIIAKAIHDHSSNREEPFITIDCTSIVESLSESILYGHEKGSFTGAEKEHHGLFEQAGNGTIFFDEVSSLPLMLQGKLLRFLQQKEYSRIGSTELKKSSARIIAATNESLQKTVANGKFRRDLYYRLKVLTIHVPSLRDRKEDIPVLIQHFLSKIHYQYDIGPIKIDDRAIQKIMEYNWPGNVRELENFLLRACIFGRQEVIIEDTVDKILSQSSYQYIQEPFSSNLSVCSLQEAEKKAILNALEASQGNMSQAANILQISRQTLRTKIRKYNLSA